MGKNINIGLASGTNGAKNNKKIDVENLKEFPGVNVTQYDINLLEEANVKFNKKNLIFVYESSDKRLIWFEKGDIDSGLIHILNQHQDDFENIGVKAIEVPKYLHDVISKGKIIETNQKSGRNYIVFQYEENKILMAIGTNGYIVSAYPYNNGGKYEKNINK